MSQSSLATGRSSDEGIESMTQEDFNMAKTLHNVSVFKPNRDSFPIITNPINDPNIMEEGNGTMKSIPNQMPTSGLFDIPIKGFNEGVTGINHNYSDLCLNKEAAINEDLPSHVQHATSVKKHATRPAGVRATRKKIHSSNSKSATNSKPRTKRFIPSVNYSKSVGHTEEGRKICGKRSGDVHLELPCKYRRVSKDESDKLFSIVEADTQPRQTQ